MTAPVPAKPKPRPRARPPVAHRSWAGSKIGSRWAAFRGGKQRSIAKPAPAAGVPIRAKRNPALAAVSRRAAPLAAADNGGTHYTLILSLLLGATVIFLALAGTRRAWAGGAAATAAPARSAPRRAPPTPRQAPPPPPTPPVPERLASPPAHPPPTAPAPQAGAAWETCEIDWWRGYVKSDFYAVAAGADELSAEVARSPAFRWRSAAEPPSTDPIVAAHDTLVQKLMGAGWEEVASGTSWYRRRYRRRLSGDSAGRT